jgi:hypothetical protein
MIILFFTMTVAAAVAAVSGDKRLLFIYTVCSGLQFLAITAGGVMRWYMSRERTADEKMRLLTEQNIQLQKENAKEQSARGSKSLQS